MPRVLITVSGKNAQPYRFSLERKIVRLGRAADNDIVIDDRSVSSHHCEMRRIEGGYILEDLGSTNGLELEGDPMEIIDLKHGMSSLIGDATLDFELSEEERDELKKEDFKPRQRAKLPPAPKKAPKTPPQAPRPGPPRVPGAAAPGAPYALSTSKRSGGVDFLITVVFLVLAALSFYLGLHIQHRKVTEGVLWEDINR